MCITFKNMKKQKKLNNKLAVFQAKNGAIEVRTDSDKETVWATQAQIAAIFEIERSVVTKHIRNIINDGELAENSVCAIFAHTASDGKTYDVKMYNLDVILAVGYRTNSVRAVEFRQWATKTLKEYITKSFVVSKRIIGSNYAKFLQSVEDVKSLLPADINLDNKSILELVKTFADTWLSLDAYDKDELKIKTITKRKVKLTADELAQAIADFKALLIKKQEATDLFAMERQQDSLAGIVGNVMQGFGGQDVYPGLEEKAAHLLVTIAAIR
ncbi:TPA: death-on-curing protein, partial [Candidatus Falkowbacteria bacterium]|nr:death-on-curing protein [Candidatus Falkowbacteria bacterium]HBT27776.1 death-on-curing protein [Candidatus Falkowbacteria bacterium]